MTDRTTDIPKTSDPVNTGRYVVTRKTEGIITLRYVPK